MHSHCDQELLTTEDDCNGFAQEWTHCQLDKDRGRIQGVLCIIIALLITVPWKGKPLVSVVCPLDTQWIVSIRWAEKCAPLN